MKPTQTNNNLTVGCVIPSSGIIEALLAQKERQLAKARKALMMCVAPDPEAEALKEEVLLEE